MRGRLLLASHITLFIFTKSESTVAIWPKAGQDAKNKVLLSEKVREQKQKKHALVNMRKLKRSNRLANKLAMMMARTKACDKTETFRERKHFFANKLAFMARRCERLCVLMCSTTPRAHVECEVLQAHAWRA